MPKPTKTKQSLDTNTTTEHKHHQRPGQMMQKHQIMNQPLQRQKRAPSPLILMEKVWKKRRENLIKTRSSSNKKNHHPARKGSKMEETTMSL